MLSAAEYRKRLYGWLSYAFASEVFVIVSLTLFLPICLEQFARDNGFLLPDRTTPCSTVAKNLDAEDSPARCVVKLGLLWIDSASFSLYVYSISVALQALTVISVGGIADNSAHRKRLLLAFALQGAFAAVLFLILPSSSPLWFLSALLAICANVGFGVSVVAMNAYLPSLAKDSREVAELRSQLEASQDAGGSDLADTSHSEGIEEPLISRTRVESSELRAHYDNELSRATSRISSLGIALGYGAGICLLLVALIPVTKLKGSTFSLRLAIGLSGIWWAVFSIPAAVWLPGPTTLATSGASAGAIWIDNLDVPDGKWSIRAEVIAAWKRLGGMLRWQEIKKLRNTFKYLAAWFLLSDGFTTITSTAILFGKTSLNMQPSALILIGVLTPCAGILGSLLWPLIQRKFLWSNLKVLIILVVLCSAIPAYGCLGRNVRLGCLLWYILFVAAFFDAILIEAFIGCVYGAFQSYARAFYAELLPPGEEARWYGLFSITDKSSSFVGPLFVGIIADMTGNIRYAFFFLVFMIWAAVPILMSVDVERGRKDAREYRYSYGSRDGHN
ncbi:related to Autophagy-related protein 22-1 [Armillaria ostoyae]|uniref:Autophagy-related protein n=1 Tax=Armillaria ostoyae TaxID=47428 RepID=A0A284RCL1_ARMOS|nr:related to Autophagy-related protein 22-1 [Armillaria ostoyae]